MGMTVSEKILARASGRDRVSPGDVVLAKVDKVMVHDVGGPGVVEVFKELEQKGLKVERLFDPDRVIAIEDHFVPPPDQKSAQNLKVLEGFVRRFGINKYYRYGLGQYGVCHVITYEERLVLPGEVYVGTDSHTTTTGALGSFAVGMGHTDVAYILMYGRIWFRVPETMLFRLEGTLRDRVMAKDVILKILKDIGADGATYKAMQFSGDGVRSMPIEERLTLTNMSVEAGAKNGIIEPDEKILDYFGGGISPVYGDEDASYSETYSYDLQSVEPMVAKPYSPANGVEARELEGTPIDKAYIGSCTGGKYYDLVKAAEVLKGRRVKVRLEVIPATQGVYRKALDSGLLKIFLDAGAMVGPPTCGACLGGHMGVLAEGEVAISSTNRNFPGRMGHRGSKVYLASPATVAASAVTGYITDPRDLKA